MSEKLDLNEQQTRLKEMLYEFDDFCEKEKITYFLAYGTLLGAVRHNDFIPWDDDIDLLIPRKDYDRLLQFESVSDSIDIVSYKNDNYYHPFVHSNLSDKKTIRISKSTRIQTDQGLFIDLFPLDYISENRLQRVILSKFISFLNMLRSFSICNYEQNSSIKNIVKNVLFFICGLFDPQKISKKIDLIHCLYGKEKSSIVGVTLFPRSVYKAEWFKKTVRIKFGSKFLCCPYEYKKILECNYGDYMILPPVEKRICLHPSDVFWK